MIAVAATTALERKRQSRGSGRPSLRAVGIDDLARLQKKLSAVPTRSDSYSQSASYYAMTGRKGLWLYESEYTFMLIAAHPNRDDHLLLFPPMGKEPARLLNQALNDERIYASKIQLARMSGQDQLLLSWAEASGTFETTPEELLDWRYPVQILSTREVAEHTGQKFRDFRKNILRAERRGLTTRRVENRGDRDCLLKLADAWAASHPHDGYTKDDLTAPDRAILHLIDTVGLPIDGIVIVEKGQPVGFIFWEETNPGEGMANSLCNVDMTGGGASEFSYLAMSQYLDERGFGTVCIGGSETAGLDQFKRKMNPVRSVPLQSAFAVRP